GDKTDSIRGNSGFEDYRIIKINSLGNIEWQKVYGGSNSDFLKSINLTIDGGYILGGKSSSPISGEKSENFRGQSDYWILKVNSLGIIEWQKTIGGRDDEYLSNIIQTSDGNYLASGYSWSNISGEKTENNNSIYEDFWIVKLNEIYANKISGKIFQSQNSNCSQEINEYGTTSVIIIAEPYNFFGISDSTGKYTILTDTGTYQLKPIYPQILKPFLQQTVCPTSGYHTVSFSQYGQDTSEINFANYEKQCPFLQLELAQGRMRRCFDNNATIKYCNIGNVDTTNVQVIIQLPEYVTFVSASNPNYIISGKKITFNIGNLRANECGTINLVTNVDCIEGIVGLTQCIKAQILPRNECVRKIQPDYAGWDKSEITTDGTCTGASVRFVIKNIGQNMADSSNCRIYKNAVQALSKNFKLLAGDSLVINVSATGHTYRLEADQTLNFPSPSAPSVTIENCNNTSVANRNFVNQQEQDKSDIAIEKVCLEIRDSYDPNDKQVFPSGVGADKRVRHKVPLDFLIRFQNTGTDTAYKVVITDTLDQNLDLATLEFGASSHSYKFEFTGAGKPIMKFTFDKINLVDSFTNEPKSHGFISFKITPYDSIPNGTLVKNNADIYFDFNLPIKTNTTQVSIDDRLPTGATLNLVTSVKQNNTIYEAIYVYPNPFTQTATFEFVYNTKANQMLIYDLKGNVVAQENIAGKTTFQLQRANLSNGMYFYAVLNNSEEIIGRGKLVLQ
nr:T9SS type A sorting domain-containing protein [Chitinophagales bacterium]